MKISVFGAGKSLESIYLELVKYYEIERIYDNNKDLWGQESVCGIKVSSPNCISEDNNKIYITSIFEIEIAKQLIELGIEPENIEINVLGKYNRYDEYELHKSGRVRVKIGDQIFWLTNNLEKIILEDIYFNEDYNLYFPYDAVVVDIGMNVGFASLFFAKKGYCKKIYAYEPDEAVYKKAMDNFNINPEYSSIINSFNYALSDSDHKEVYKINPRVSAGILKNRKEGLEGFQDIEITCFKSSDIIKKVMQENKNMPCVIKCDCEGAEYEIFQELDENGLLKHVSAVVMEWHAGRRKEIEAIFERNSFVFIANNTTSQGFGKITAVRMK